MEGIVRGVLIAGEEKIRRLKMTQSCLFEAIIFLSIFNVNFFPEALVILFKISFASQ